ncbi:hypothetical protein KIW84_075829 [Lathyrus oleraceus]|uniref:Uncharacterized protein n=1 Tax=Pisum sativum TaxID=3888 RepID=A0A9D4VUW0_PEA|nr:hypothetical protein KIW84_075829 [Pisum sativum]
MADNTRSKEMAAELRRQAEMLEKSECPNIDLHPTQTEAQKEQDIDQTVEHHLLLNALNGTTGFGVIRFKVLIGPLSVSILLDGGSSDSFV